MNDKNVVIEKLRELAIKHCERADWYNSLNSLKLAEFDRLRQRTYLDIIIIMGFSNLDIAKKEIEEICYSLFNEYKYLQSENFISLAELVMIQYQTFGNALSYLSD